MNIFKQIKNCKFSKLIGVISLSAFVGAFAMNEYNHRVDFPKLAALAHYETMVNLTSRVVNTYDKSDKRRDIAFEFLSLQGSHIAYFFRINEARNAAFKASNLSSRKYDEASIDAVDTRPADALLLEAMDHLSDADLYWVLRYNASRFDQSSRADIRSRLEKNDYNSPILRYIDLKNLHSMLSELERSKLQDCYKKLEDTREGAEVDEVMTKAGMCSKKTSFEPYVVWKGYSESIGERIFRVIGITSGY